MILSDIVDKAKFNDKGLMPAIIQDNKSKTVLMLAYMNRLALEKTIETGLTHFWSRSREKLWMKGETSGHIQRVVSMSLDCDCDTLLVNVEQTAAACHTGTFSCFSETVEVDCCGDLKGINANGKASDMLSPDLDLLTTDTDLLSPDTAEVSKIEILQKLYNIILDRKANPKEGSYTKYLFEKGLDKILKKVGEESAEVIIAAKNQNADEIIYEVSDLVYHVMVLLAEREVSPEAIYQELEKRFKP